jgi:hypothetical protein
MLTDEQRFLFDVKGFLLLPSLLTFKETAAARRHVLANQDKARSSFMGAAYTGATGELLDHPAVVAVLEELLSDNKPNPDFYDFRCEDSFFSVRTPGAVSGGTRVPHTVRPAHTGGPMSYQSRNGRIYSGLTRVVWELNPVRKGMGGTLFLPGSHKADFAVPAGLRDPDNRHMESYECPAGSALIFTESLLHATATWRDRKNKRVATFTAYNSLWAQWYRMNLDPKIIEAMPAKRATLFRGVYANNFNPDTPLHGYNKVFAENNRAL